MNPIFAIWCMRFIFKSARTSKRKIKLDSAKFICWNNVQLEVDSIRRSGEGGGMRVKKSWIVSRDFWIYCGNHHESCKVIFMGFFFLSFRSHGALSRERSSKWWELVTHSTYYWHEYPEKSVCNWWSPHWRFNAQIGRWNWFVSCLLKKYFHKLNLIKWYRCSTILVACFTYYAIVLLLI